MICVYDFVTDFVTNMSTWFVSANFTEPSWFHDLSVVLLVQVIRRCLSTTFIHAQLKQSVQQVDEDVKYEEHEGKDVQHQVRVERQVVAG